MKKIRFSPSALVIAVVGLFTPALVHAQFDFTLNASDGSGTSSFNTDGNWSPTNGNPTLEANSGASYGVVGFTLRTPASSGNVFGGSLNANTVSLALGNGITQGSIQVVTGTSTINNLTMNNGRLTASANTTVAGGISLIGTNNEFNGGTVGRTLVVASSISGTGGVNIATTTNTAGTTTVRLTGTGNTYSGGTTIVGRNSAGLVLLDVQTEGALGTGNLTLNEFSRLTLGTGTSASNFIGDGATLSLATGLADGAINLNFIGSDIIGAISFDGGTTFGGLGTYGALGSGATYEHAVFSGTGLLTVIPEPGTYGIFFGVGLLLLVCIRRHCRHASTLAQSV